MLTIEERDKIEAARRLITLVSETYTRREKVRLYTLSCRLARKVAREVSSEELCAWVKMLEKEGV